MTTHTFVVLISGNGSNLQAIIDAVENGQIHARISAVISNRTDAGGLQRAQVAGIETRVFNTAPDETTEQFDHRLVEYIDSLNPDLIVLAGYMKILSDFFVDHYPNKILNIHPSLLPKYKGLNTHQRAIENNDAEHGASVHVVHKELDSGPVIIQAKTDVEKKDSKDSLAARVLKLEHIIYPLTLQWYFEDRLKISEQAVCFDNQILNHPIQWPLNNKAS